jgi:hypothetical protein
MSSRFIPLSFSFSFAIAFAALTTPCFAAATTSPQGENWASIAQLPDWTGSWRPDPYVTDNQGDYPIPLTPPYAQTLAELRRVTHTPGGDVPSNTKWCIPIGPSQTRLSMYEYAFMPGAVVVLPETNEVRHIFTDGRPHKADRKPSYSGDSIGHWEGDTLIVDTVGMRADSEWLHGFKTGPAAADMRLVERMRLTAPNKLEIVNTYYSDIALTEPYTFTITKTRVPYRMSEDICTQNNRDIDPTGSQTFNATPPPLR